MAALCQKYSGPTKHFIGGLRRGLAHSGAQRPVDRVRFCRRQGWGWSWATVVPSPGPCVILLLHSPLLEPGPPALLFLTESTLHSVCGQRRGQCGGRPVRRLRRGGTQGAGHSGRGGGGLTCERPDRLMRAHSWGALPRKLGPAPVCAFAPFFT